MPIGKKNPCRRMTRRVHSAETTDILRIGSFKIDIKDCEQNQNYFHCHPVYYSYTTPHFPVSYDRIIIIYRVLN